MALLRKILAILSGIAGLFFAVCVALMPPAHPAVLIILAIVAGIMLLAAPLLWPRRPKLALDFDRRLRR